jgi:Beta-lactamase
MTTRPWFPFSGLVVTLFISVAPAQSQCDSTQLPTRFAEVASSARERATKGELPSIAIAVAQNGRIVCEEAFGWADREKKIPATPNTVYAAGSIAKVPAICRTRTWMKRSTMPCVPASQFRRYTRQASDITVTVIGRLIGARFIFRN